MGGSQVERKRATCPPGTVVGNVRDTALIDIWNGSAMRKLRMIHLAKRHTGNSACANCQTMQGLPDDSDLYDNREILLQLFSDGD